MKRIRHIWLFMFLWSCYSVQGQRRVVDSLKLNLATDNDTLRLVLCQQLTDAYNLVNIDSALSFAKQYVALSQKLQYRLNEAEGLLQTAYNGETNSAAHMDLILRAQRILNENTDKRILPSHFLSKMQIPVHLHNYESYRLLVHYRITSAFSYVYWSNGKYSKALPYATKAAELANELQMPELLVSSNLALGVLTENDDTAMVYLKKANEIAQKTGKVKELGVIYDFTAKRYAIQKDYQQQLALLHASLKHYLDNEMTLHIGWGYLGLGEFYQRSIVNVDSSLFYTHKAYQTATAVNYIPVMYWSSKDLYDWYKKLGNKDSVFKYADIMLAARDKTFNQQVDEQFEEVDYRQELERSAIEKAGEKYRNRIRLYLFLGGIFICVLFAIFFWRNAVRRKRAYAVLQKQKVKTDQALQELRSTQQQLIQSEKMASLGELTAGIAHEIQNPLNFVNNFSEVNDELLKELKTEAEKGNLEEVKAIANDIAFNSEKINHHGKRAEAIVKGMLQHSRSSTGQKEPTDINALVNEYLRLAYHGLRAKDKSFNAKFETHFDDSVGKVNLIPQDIGRVILNLSNNAFYTVSERKKREQNSYEPTVSVTTSKNNGKIEIKVGDNGNGIPQKVLEKIFQPFFTTKPTGQGTGLGLSLAYDIITKGHGGELRVETKEGEGSEFIILL